MATTNERGEEQNSSFCASHALKVFNLDINRTADTVRKKSTLKGFVRPETVFPYNRIKLNVSVFVCN